VMVMGISLWASRTIMTMYASSSKWLDYEKAVRL
jgi:hypothetical protein